jgi:hypothetical protein
MISSASQPPNFVVIVGLFLELDLGAAFMFGPSRILKEHGKRTWHTRLERKSDHRVGAYRLGQITFHNFLAIEADRPGETLGIRIFTSAILFISLSRRSRRQ